MVCCRAAHINRFRDECLSRFCGTAFSDYGKLADGKEYLDQFAFHYQTGEKIPAELIQRIIDASNYIAGYLCLRQLSFGYLDMAYHTLMQPFSSDIREFERNAIQHVQLLPVIPETCISTSFGHIFSGGYAAGYYSYKWAEVLDADAFSVFKETASSIKKQLNRSERTFLKKEIPKIR